MGYLHDIDRLTQGTLASLAPLGFDVSLLRSLKTIYAEVLTHSALEFECGTSVDNVISSIDIVVTTINDFFTTVDIVIQHLKASLFNPTHHVRPISNGISSLMDGTRLETIRLHDALLDFECNFVTDQRDCDYRRQNHYANGVR